MAGQLQRIGLADRVKAPAGDEMTPRNTAVLLFANEPGSLLAAFGSRAGIRLVVVAGKWVDSGATLNLRRPPRTVLGPLIEVTSQADAGSHLGRERGRLPGPRPDFTTPP